MSGRVLLLAAVGAAGCGKPSTLPACVGTCEPAQFSPDGGMCPPMTYCKSDADCPLTDRNDAANGPRCVTVCGQSRFCRTPCTKDSDCTTSNPVSLACTELADDGTRDGEIGLAGRTSHALCGQYLTCWQENFSPAH